MTAPIPPVGVEHLVRWLREYRGAFTEEALRGRLLEAGHPRADVEAAFSRLRAEEAPGAGPPASDGRRGRDAVLAFLAALAAILGIPALLAAAGAPGFAVAVAFAAVLLALVAWGMARESGRPGVATGLGAALILTVLSPVIAVVALFGYCLVGGGRVF
jgi:hypothetical protein